MTLRRAAKSIATAIARPACAAQTSPKRVPSTDETTSQLSASPSPKPPAFAPCRTIPASAITASPPAEAASRRDSLDRVSSGCSIETDDEHQRPAAHEEQQQEVERADDRRTRPSPSAACRLRAPAPRRRPGSHWGRRHGRRTPPRRDARPPTPPARSRCRCLEPGAVSSWIRASFSLGRSTLPESTRLRMRVVDTDRAERGLDRLVEPQQHEPRALLEHRVVRRLSCDQPRVRTRRRHQRERHQNGGDRDEHQPARTTARVIVHRSSLRSAAEAGRSCSTRRAAAGRGRHSRGRGPARAGDRPRARTGTAIAVPRGRGRRAALIACATWCAAVASANAIAAARSANGTCVASPSRKGADTRTPQCSVPVVAYRSISSCSTKAAGASAATSLIRVPPVASRPRKAASACATSPSAASASAERDHERRVAR